METRESGRDIGRSTLLAFALITFTVLALQIVISRLFGATVGYYYAFMLVSLALLGLGSGALIVQQAPRLFSPERLEIQSAWLSMAAGVCCMLGTLVMLWIYPNLQHAKNDFWTLGGIFWCFFPCFLFTGTVVSLVLGHTRHIFHRVYAVDLGSAALGCVVAVGILASLSPSEGLLRLMACLPIVAAAMFALGGRRYKLALGALVLAVATMIVGGLLCKNPRIVNPPHLSWLNRKSGLSRWNAFSNVTVYKGHFFTWALSPKYRGPLRPMLDLLIDGIGGTEIVLFDGKPNSLKEYHYLDMDLTALSHRMVPPEGRQLILGPGGGVDILQASRHGRKDITVVEINPLVEQVVNENLADFSGRPYRLPGVKVHIENGRTFVKRSQELWDLITLTWVDTGGSASSFAFSENYLYTVEAYKEFLNHLKPKGFLAFMRALGYRERRQSDTMRGISVAVEALEQLGVRQPGSHLVVLGAVSPFFNNRPMCFVMAKKTPFDPDEIQEARTFAAKYLFQPIWLPDRSVRLQSLPKPYKYFAPTIHQIITATDRDAVYRDSRFDIEPATDDNPFYFVERAGVNRKAGKEVTTLGHCMLILLALVIPFLGLPILQLVRRTSRLGLSGVTAMGYFSLLGIAFMAVEIEMFHVFALVLGSPTYSLVVVLGSLLVF
ncbi:MAG: hypothetical protein V1754_11325, partial [Pseudomonadota bacterium]